MKPYDESKDLKDYVEVFEGLMDFQAATDAINCRAFQIALTGSARLWYRRLAARSISTYSQLRKDLLANFLLGTTIGRQQLTSPPLGRKKTGRLEKQIDQKKPNQEKKKVDSKSKDKGLSASGNRTEYRRSKIGPNRSRPYERYTSTTILISEILTNIEESGMEKLLKRPEKLRGEPEKRNKDKYCRFHRDHGHNTSNCWELKCQFEDLIQDGYFKKFVGKPRSNSVEKKEERKRSRTPPRRDDRPAVINTIFGGPSGGQSGNKRKELAREARREVCIIREQKPTCSITFGDADLEGVHLPHNDAFVIAPLIDHVLVRRVLVDGGASANILSLPTYLALGWTR
ncbi:uncharacterized protein LOC111025038 [Momordica charantia]|uniref:Uncharacterized protein LOC111025038 n=1 Tax=Momordica charantia TaxID=3673 RepID=A0A6J1DWH9_MOMCH|nr:uncharacterized protein LOC111025038 [Momordica charantia]